MHTYVFLFRVCKLVMIVFAADLIQATDNLFGPLPPIGPFAPGF